MNFARALVITIGVTFPTLALAEPGAIRGACMNDIRTLCAGVQPGGGRIRDCIKEQRSQLSQACKMAIAERLMARRGNGSSAGRNFGPLNKDAD
jgi:hypothetical protein